MNITIIKNCQLEDSSLPSFLHKPHVHMKNKTGALIKLGNLINGGRTLLRIVTDFDRTLTKDNVDGVPTKSSNAVFELSPHLPTSYKVKSQSLRDKYYPIEKNVNITEEEKLPLMIEWWTKALDLCIGLNVDQCIIDNAVALANVSFRDGCDLLFARLYECSIPLLILSAGLGDVILSQLCQKKLYYDNIHVVSNFFKFSECKIIGFTGPVVHLYNKNKVTAENIDYFQKNIHRTNMLLMGDSLGDANMVEDVADISNVLKVGFLTTENINVELPVYLELFDIVIVNDQTMEIPLEILRLITSQTL